MIKQKLGIKSDIALVRLAMRYSIIDIQNG